MDKTDLCNLHDGICQCIKGLRKQLSIWVMVAIFAFGAVAAWIRHVDETAASDRLKIETIAAAERKELMRLYDVKYEKLTDLINKVNTVVVRMDRQLETMEKYSERSRRSGAGR